MQRIRKSPTKLVTPIGIVCLVILLSAAGVASYHYGLWPFQHDNQPKNESESKEKQTSTQSNKLAKQNSQKSSTNVDSSKSTSEIPVGNTMSVNITNLSQDGGTVSYTASISGGSTDGTCSAVFTNPYSKPVTRTTAASSSTCGPVSIPENEFAAIGTWKLTLRYYENETQAYATKTIEVK